MDSLPLEAPELSALGACEVSSMCVSGLPARKVTGVSCFVSSRRVWPWMAPILSALEVPGLSPWKFHELSAWKFNGLSAWKFHELSALEI